MDMNELRAKIEVLPCAPKQCMVNLESDFISRAEVLALFPTPNAPQETAGEAVAWQWRSRIKGGAWDAWEMGRFRPDYPPPFMEVEERPLYTHPTPAAAPTDICPKCMGTGTAGHPDSGYTCDCNGGMVAAITDNTLIHAVGKHLLEMGEDFRVGQGSELADAYQAALESYHSTDNTALVDRDKVVAGISAHYGDLTKSLAILDAALASRPAEATSREGVDDMPDRIFAHPDKEWTFHKGISRGVEYIRAGLTSDNETAGLVETLRTISLTSFPVSLGEVTDQAADVITALQAKLAEVEAERDAARDTNRDLHRRTQDAERMAYKRAGRMDRKASRMERLYYIAIDIARGDFQRAVKAEAERDTLQAQVTEARAVLEYIANENWERSYQARRVARAALTPTVSDAAQEGDKV